MARVRLVTAVLGVVVASSCAAPAPTPTPTSTSLTSPSAPRTTLTPTWSPSPAAPTASPFRPTGSPTGDLIPPAPIDGRSFPAYAWTGTELVIAGGTHRQEAPRGQRSSGAAYDPNANVWHSIASEPDCANGYGPQIWTGTQLLEVNQQTGASCPQSSAALAVYEPSTNKWHLVGRPTSKDGIYAAVWTGDSVITWGNIESPPDTTDGAAYNPASAMWRELSPSPLSARHDYSMVWTGHEVVVWGGARYGTHDVLADGAAYDPVSDSWRSLAPGPLSGRSKHSAVWMGDQMLVWGGITTGDDSWNDEDLPGDGATYDPNSDRWTLIPNSPLNGLMPADAVWTGREVVIWGGTMCGRFSDYTYCSAYTVNSGAAYNPETQTWRFTALSPLSPRGGHVSASTGDSLIYWGGQASWGLGELALDDGAMYDPSEDTWISR